MPTSLKTLTKPQRDLLTAVDTGQAWWRDVYPQPVIYIRGDGYRETRVNGKTWDALEGAGLAQWGPKPAAHRAPRPAVITDKGKQVLAGETVNTARSLTFTVRLGDATVVRSVPLPSSWHRFADSHSHMAAQIRNDLLAELVAVEWVESDEVPAP